MHTGTGSILVVDDEAYILDVTNEILTYLGYNVNSYNNGREAVEYFRVHHDEIDAVILDIVMPELGGYDCFKQLREIDPNVRVVVSSGYAMDEEAQRILDEGARSFVHKPFDVKSLSAALNKAVADT